MITESLSALWWRWVSSRGSIIIGVTVASSLLALAIYFSDVQEPEPVDHARIAAKLSRISLDALQESGLLAALMALPDREDTTAPSPGADVDDLDALLDAYDRSPQ